MSAEAKAELDRHFEWIAQKLPDKGARFIRWLRQPSSRLVRIPLALLLVLGGIFSILPVLGIWMLPLGLLLIAQDVPFLQQPLANALGWMERKWMGRKDSSNGSSRDLSKDLSNVDSNKTDPNKTDSSKD